MEYRQGTANDIDAAWAVIQSAVSEMWRHGIDQWDELYPARGDIECDIEKGTLWLACEADDIAAIYVISTECDEAYGKGSWEGPDAKACVLHRFCVSPRFQHRGIGKKVLAHIEEQLGDMGYGAVRLDVFTENPYALRLYRGNGYVQRGCADWRKGRFLLMEKQLEK